RFGEFQSAAAAPLTVDKAFLYQRLRHLHQMVPRDTIAVGHFFDCVNPVRLEREQHHQAQGIVGVQRQTHRDLSGKAHGGRATIGVYYILLLAPRRARPFHRSRSSASTNRRIPPTACASSSTACGHAASAKRKPHSTTG